MIGQTPTTAYVACVPHVPLLSMQAKQQNPLMWEAYDARIKEFESFDPDLVIVFGGDHYSNIHLDLAPSFLIGHNAEAINDCGGTPGKLSVPRHLTTDLVDYLVGEGFDMAVSYAMKVDHGFSNVLSQFLRGKLDARPVIPVHINTLTDPRPTMKRCRQLGEAIGRWAGTLHKKVAFLASGGLSHQTNSLFHQYESVPNEEMRKFIVHGGSAEGITDQKWHGDIHRAMEQLSTELIRGTIKAPINKDWDNQFLRTLGTGDLQAFDTWSDADIVQAAGYGGSEIRGWLAAAAAGAVAGAPNIEIDFYSGDTTLAIGVGVAHAAPRAV